LDAFPKADAPERINGKLMPSSINGAIRAEAQRIQAPGHENWNFARPTRRMRNSTDQLIKH
jgi:hypothetical protein